MTVAGDEVTRGKPHPEPYLTAAARLGVDPRRLRGPRGLRHRRHLRGGGGRVVVGVPHLVERAARTAPHARR